MSKTKVKFRFSARKVLATFVDQRTVNGAYCCQLFQSAKTTYPNKRRGMSIRDVTLLYDNVRPHTAILTRDKLEEMGWKTLEHPPYSSPALSPCVYLLFAPLKESLEGERFESNEEVQEQMCNWLTTRPQTFYIQGIIFKLPNRWQKCVDQAGDYFE